MLKLTWPQAAAWRIRRQHLDRRAPAGSLLAVASRLCGLHAQVMSSAELTLWARVEDLDRREVQRALWEDRTLVKTWAKRAQSWGTILKPAAFTGRLCFGPSLGQRVRFTRPDTWLAAAVCPLGPPVHPQAATAAVTRRYLAANGPATYRDLARWWNGG